MTTSEDRCEITDLLVNQCGCRTHRGRPAPRVRDLFEEAEETAPWVPATWPGECSGCFLPFGEGDDIRADGCGGWEGRCCDG